MIKIYGHPQTSAGRCYWLMEELGLKYQQVPLDMKAGEHKSPEYLKLNPNGKIPCLIDDDLVLWESMAINHYLTEKHKPELFGSGLKEKARTMQWNYWAIVEYQKPLIDMLIQMIFVPEPKRDHEVIKKSRERAIVLNELLDQELSGKNYLIQHDFTLADLNVASVAKINKMTQIDISQLKNLDSWLNKVCERPAHLKLDELGKS